MNQLFKEDLEDMLNESVGEGAKRPDYPLALGQTCHLGGHLVVEYHRGLVTVKCAECFRDVATAVVAIRFQLVPAAIKD